MDQPRFELHACLGSGGFGEVYLATEHTEGGITREVAVKVLHDALDESSDAVKRLRDEGQLLALLAHPAILGVHEFTAVDGRLALVTEYVEGVDLAAYCTKEKRLPVRVAVLVVQEVAEALDFAWRTVNPATERPLHLIHRDIKPENVRLSKTGQVKLLDFGVARSTEVHRRAKTAAGQVMLTPGYGAPETLVFGITGPYVDVFALGATLYAMITGEAYYEHQSLGHQVALASDSVDYQAHLDERLTHVEEDDVRSLLRDMLEFAHERRPTMDEVADRCDRLARRLEGPGIMQWTRTIAFPAPSTDTGRLTGCGVLANGDIVWPGDESAPADPAPVDLPGRTPSAPVPSLADAPLHTWVDEDDSLPPDATPIPAEETAEVPPSEPEPPAADVPVQMPAPSAVPTLERPIVPAPPTPPPVVHSVTPAPAPGRSPFPSPPPAPPQPAPPAPPAADNRMLGLLLVLAGAVLVLLGLAALVTAWTLY